MMSRSKNTHLINNLFIILVLVTQMFATAFPVSAAANDEPETSGQMSLEDIAYGVEVGNQTLSADNVPVFSEQLAAQEGVQQQETRTTFKAKITPEIFTLGKSLRLHLAFKADARLRSSALYRIQFPDGVVPNDKKVVTTLAKDGVLEMPAKRGQEIVELDVNPDQVVFPISIAIELVIGGKVVNEQFVTVDQGKFELSRRGGVIDTDAGNGKVRLDIPDGALATDARFDVRTPSPQKQPAVSLTWDPVEIIAVNEMTGEDIKSFSSPITVQFEYDEEDLFTPDEENLLIYYYDEDAREWFPLPTTVDAKTNTLRAESDHLTIFDYKASSWQAHMLPTVDAFKVADFTGAATYNVNFWTPPGPAGLQPTLSLNYNSQIIDEGSIYSQASWVGMGWNLDTGAITRNMHETNTDFGDDTFSISMGGVSGLLLPVSQSGNVTTYNTADRSFMKITFDSSTNTWTVVGKDGTSYVFNHSAKTHTTNGCVATSGALDITWRWSLTSVTDINNNTLTYSYFNETKPSCANVIAVYPQSISYPNGKYQIDFVRDTTRRTDYQTAWADALERTLYGTYRLKEISIKHLGSPVRRYEFSYTTASSIYPAFTWGAGGKTLTLAGVQEFNSDKTRSLPATQFTYDEMHLTDVNNGQGGTVHIDYERWHYFDDINDRLRSLFTRFGTEECAYNGGWTIGTDWTHTSGGPVGCYLDGNNKYLQVGYQNPSGGTAVAAVATRSVPEHVMKPGARYRLAINGTSFRAGIGLNWGFREMATGRKDIQYDNSLPAPNVDRSLEMPVDFDPVDTKLYLECTDCLLTKYQFALMPSYWRATSRTVSDSVTSRSTTYSYDYDNPTPNTAFSSGVVAGVSDYADLYTYPMREYRGNASTHTVNSEGLATTNWYLQTDHQKGTQYKTLTYQESYYDNLDTLATASWTTAGGTHEITSRAEDYDTALKSVNTASNWNVSVSRDSSVSTGQVVVAHSLLSGANAQGEVGLVGSPGFFGLVISPETGGHAVRLQDGTLVLAPGDFELDRWYGIILLVDSGSMHARIWQLDDPSNTGEGTTTGIGGSTWTFRERANNGTLWLDTYTEGYPYQESTTEYASTVQVNNNALSQSGLQGYHDLDVIWSYPTSTENRFYNGDASWSGTKNTYEYLSGDQNGLQYGNLTRQVEHEWNGSAWQAYRGTKTEFYPNSTASLVSLPARQIVLDCASGCDFSTETGLVSETLYLYDGNSTYSTSPTTGRLTAQRAWVEGTNYSQVSYGYTMQGNLSTVTNYTNYGTQSATPAGSSQTTTTTYDADGYNTYPVTVTNAEGHVVSTQYRYDLGLPNQVSNPNSVATTATYDDFGRLKTITAPGDPAPTLQITYNDAAIPYQVDLIQRVDATSSIRLSRFYSGWGEEIQSQVVGAVVNGSPQNVVSDSQYDVFGRLVKQTVPYQTTYAASPSFVSQTFTQSHTTTAYDVFGRIEDVVAPNGNTTGYTYTDLATTVEDPENNTTTSTADVWGRTVSVDVSTGPDLTYDYDVVGLLTDAYYGSEHTEITYDALGRKKSMTDPDMGYWSYIYDALGNLASQTDARGCVLTLTYDDINRLTGKSSSGTSCGQQISATYGYDDETNGNQGVGHLTSMSNQLDTTSSSWVYDDRGRVIKEQKSITGSSLYITEWTYNSADLPETMKYPDNEIVTYSYNSDGTLNSMTSSLGSTTYLGDMQYDEAGRITSMEYGDDIIQKTYAYFPWNTSTTGGALETVSATRTSDNQSLQSFTYDYDGNGNVETITDALAGPQVHTFGYDTINRLISADVTGGTEGLYSETYTYNSTTGNFLTKGDITYAFDNPDHAHAVSGLSDGSYFVYDPNGNMIERSLPGQTYDLTYDAENHLVSAVSTPPQIPMAASKGSEQVLWDKISLGTDLDAMQQDVLVSWVAPTLDAVGKINGDALMMLPVTNPIFSDDFESGDLSAWGWSSTSNGDLSVTTNAAAVGAYGMQAVVNDADELYVGDGSPANETHYRARFYLDPNSISIPLGSESPLFIGDGINDYWQAVLYLGQQGGYYTLTLVAMDDADTWREGSTVYITDDWQAVEIEWVAASSAGANDGYLNLWVNDTFVDSITDIDNDTQTMDEVAFGILDTGAGISGTLYFDAFASSQGDAIGLDPNGPSVSPPPLDLIFFDGFESGDFSAWDWVEDDGGNLSVSTQAAGIGSYGLEALINDLNEIYAQDNTPTAESHYSARFYFDPNSISIPNGETFDIFRGDAGSNWLFRIRVSNYSGMYSLSIETENDAGGWEYGGDTYFSDAWQAIEMEWQAASAPGANDGYIKLWLNDVLIDTISNIDNDEQALEDIYLGATSSLDAGTSGTIYFDAFESRQGTYIGLDPNGPSVSPPMTDLLFFDNFESGDLTSWDSVSANSDLSASAAAAYQGSYGMETLIDDLESFRVKDNYNYTFDETHYRASFFFDPNSLVMNPDTNHAIFDVQNGDLDITISTLYLYYEDGEYKIRARTALDDSTYVYSNRHVITDDWHVFEIEWQAASAPGADDGFFKFWIDELLVEAFDNLDNDTLSAQKTRLGVLYGVDAGASGSMYFDNFESRRETFIGQLDANYLTFAPTDDASIRVSSPNSNYGTDTELNVDLDSEKDFLLKFDVSGVGSNQVAGATLYLKSVGYSDLGGDFYQVLDNSWQEGTVTWNTAPVAETTIIDSIGGTDSSSRYMVDLTSLITGDGAYSLRVKSTSTDGSDFSSKEGGYAPQLVLTLSGATCYPLTLSHTGQGSDPVASLANSPGCPAGQYVAGENISLSGAVSDAVWEIAGWTGTDDDLSIADTNMLTMPANVHTVDVNYVQSCYALTFGHTGQGSDPVASPANSASCAAGEYVAGESISLSVVPDMGWEIAGWTGTDDDLSIADANTLTMPASMHAVNVNYTEILVPTFTGATFTYDGDGNRVKSEISTNMGTTTTYFIGNYYEVENGVVTKYYYAGGQRIVMRQGNDVNYILSDHLGSTSQVTDSAGTVISETRYTAWGEVRYSSANSPTNYTYTGQYSNMDDFGLMYYNARWYDPYLKSFTAPDSIVPNPYNPQDYNRYSYVRNNPIKYVDPTGHYATYDESSSCVGDNCASSGKINYLFTHPNKPSKHGGYQGAPETLIKQSGGNQPDSFFAPSPEPEYFFSAPEDPTERFSQVVDGTNGMKYLWDFAMAISDYQLVIKKGFTWGRAINPSPVGDLFLGGVGQAVSDLDKPYLTLNQRLYRARDAAGQSLVTGAVSNITAAGVCYGSGGFACEASPFVMIGVSIYMDEKHWPERNRENWPLKDYGLP